MTCTLHVAWDDQLSGYDFGPDHPMAPLRLKLTMELAQAFGLLLQTGVRVEVPPGATDAELELVHDPAYVALVRLAGDPAHQASDLTGRMLVKHGLGTEDDPAHHGDGVQAVFWDDPRVLTISLHEHPATLFPGTGLPSETGGVAAEGSAVNVALPAGTRAAGWLRAFHAVVPPLLRAFKPQILVSQHGCDTHWSDPLANLELTIDGQRAAHAAIHALAHEVAGGRWLLTGGGGYQHVQVVPRSWTHLLLEAAGSPLDPESPTPGLWREYVDFVASQESPQRMTEDGWAEYYAFESGYDPAEPVDRAIMATRKAVFPLHGLMP